MLDYLIDREKEEMFRVSTRILSFPDSEDRRIETYRLVWAWFDRVVGYEFGPDEDHILDLTLKCAGEEGLPLNEALGKVLNHLVRSYETDGLDMTDDPIALTLARKGVERFHAKKQGRH